jgi:hypothetical protein
MPTCCSMPPAVVGPQRRCLEFHAGRSPRNKGQPSASPADRPADAAGRLRPAESSFVTPPRWPASAAVSRPISFATRARSRWPARASANRHPAPTRTHQPRHYLDPPAGHRQRRDRRHHPRPPPTDDRRRHLAARVSGRPRREGALDILGSRSARKTQAPPAIDRPPGPKNTSFTRPSVQQRRRMRVGARLSRLAQSAAKGLLAWAPIRWRCTPRRPRNDHPRWCRRRSWRRFAPFSVRHSEGDAGIRV